MRVLILGGSGMLGHALLAALVSDTSFDVHATVRSFGLRQRFPANIGASIHAGIDALDEDALLSILDRVRPNVVVNCIGLVKQLAAANDPLAALPINALLPHRLARMTALCGARLIHVSTDCVYDGTKGNYSEDDPSDAKDLYGRSKYLGEVSGPNAITLRTSIVGHDLLGATEGLVEWFLAQKGTIRGYTHAIFSGLTTLELSKVIRDLVIPRPDLTGLYHVSAAPISKFDLLEIVRRVYAKDIDIVPDDRLVLDRSLDSTRFCAATGYTAPSWTRMVEDMHASRD